MSNNDDVKVCVYDASGAPVGCYYFCENRIIFVMGNQELDQSRLIYRNMTVFDKERILLSSGVADFIFIFNEDSVPPLNVVGCDSYVDSQGRLFWFDFREAYEAVPNLVFVPARK